MYSTLIKLAIGAFLLGVVVGLLLFGLVVVFEDALLATLDYLTVRGRGGPSALLLLTACVGGRLGIWWMRRVSDMSGMSIVTPLALIAGASALGTGYFLSIGKVSLPHSQVLGLLAMSAAGLVVTACVTEWLDQ